MSKATNIFSEKLKNHEMPIDDSFWADMEKRLDSQHRKPAPIWLWAGGIAASLAVILTLYPLMKTENISPIVAEIIETQEVNNPVENLLAENTNKKADSENVSSRNKRKNIVTEHYPDTILCDFSITIPETSKSENPTNTAAEEKTQSKNSLKELTAKTNTPAKETNKNVYKAKKTKQPFSIALAANYSSGTSSSGGNSPDKFAVANTSLYGIQRLAAEVSDEMNIDQILEQYPDENHLPPLSISISLRKNLNSRFALETGLTYSYLHSIYNNDETWGNDSWIHDRATLTQHYLGIPLNLITNIISNKAWNMYVSLGGMVEKGLWLEYNRTQTYSYSEQVYNQHFQDKVQGVQWSVAAAVGASYNLSKNFSLYLEPKINYYFDCKQPQSFRTASPLNLGLNAGIRVEI
ncbi:MAG: PorT family protein [Paludibacter sp.]|jgi:hypothetical protein|nr:PorT family protein [Paludibacter sp.]